MLDCFVNAESNFELRTKTGLFDLLYVSYTHIHIQNYSDIDMCALYLHSL